MVVCIAKTFFPVAISKLDVISDHLALLWLPDASLYILIAYAS